MSTSHSSVMFLPTGMAQQKSGMRMWKTHYVQMISMGKPFISKYVQCLFSRNMCHTCCFLWILVIMELPMARVTSHDALKGLDEESQLVNQTTWRFPQVGVPQNHPFYRIFHFCILPTIHFWLPPFMETSTYGSLTKNTFSTKRSDLETKDNDDQQRFFVHPAFFRHQKNKKSESIKQD